MKKTINIEKIFKDLGFEDFVLKGRSDLENILDIMENDKWDKVNCIDVLPYRVDEEFGTMINIVEDYYIVEKKRFITLRNKWISIILRFSCYYHLDNIWVMGTGTDKYKELYLEIDGGFILEFTPSIMAYLEKFVEKVEKKTINSDIYFNYKSIGLIIRFSKGDFFATAEFITKEPSVKIEQEKATALIKLLSEAEGLFIR